MFGANKTTSAFVGPNTTASSQPVTTGSSNPSYAATTEKDTTTNTNLQYQAISCMPAYQGTSFEELRFQDYQQNRKTASTNAFGQTSFGGAQPAGSSMFGAQNAQQQNNQTNSTFGIRPAGSGFGAFGGGNTGTTGTTGTTSSIFGGGTNTTSAFGQPQQPQQPSAFGAFGQPQPQQQPQQPQQPAQTGPVFGNTGTGGAFGSTAGAFGGNSTAGAFGQNPAQQPQQNSIFGQPQNTSAGTFGTFGNTANNNKPSIFGQPAGQTNQPATTGFSGGIFSSQPNQQQQPNPTPSLFGNPGGFGNTNTNQQQSSQPAGNSLFGNTQNTGTTGGGLFGGGGFGLNNPNQQQQQQQQNQQPATSAFGGGLFNSTNKPVAAPSTGPFGSTFGTQQPANNQGGGLFGNSLNQSTNQQQQSTLGGGSLFGPKPPMMGQSTSAVGTTGLFGSTFPPSINTPNLSTANPGAQGTLTASISQPIGANLPIFSMLPPGPRAVDLEQSTKKKPSFFVDMPTRSPLPHMSYTPTNSKLRGFGPSPTKSGIFNISTNGNPLTLSRSQSPSIFNGRPASPSLGSGQRKSVKKLILDKKVEPTDLFIKSNESPGKIVFSPALSISAREKEAAALLASSATTAAPPAKSSTPPRPTRTPNKFTASQSNAGADDSADSELQEGDYYVKPDLTTLKTAGYDQLTSYKDLVVGRVGYGEIHFLEPVDLTGLPKLGALLGEVIRFEEKECSVYPDSEETDKPPPGSGLNVKARIILERCWAIGKAHREPIKDENSPVAIKHLKRLKGMKDTHFESFDIGDGTWTFTVDHF